jgi:hypothetical protein
MTKDHHDKPAAHHDKPAAAAKADRRTELRGKIAQLSELQRVASQTHLPGEETEEEKDRHAEIAKLQAELDALPPEHSA